MRTILHPGPVAAERAAVVACRAHPVAVTLRGGLTVLDAMAAGLAALGFRGGWLRLDGAALSRLAYVVPAPAPGDGHAAWYSDTRVLTAAPRILSAGAHLGLRDGAPFAHCHGLWAEAGAAPRMGHLLPADSVLAADAVVEGWGLTGAVMDAAEDAETRFRLFRPRPDGAAGEGGRPALLAALRPNQDLCAAVAALAPGAAQVEGIGSLVGTVFEDGDGTASYGTEILLTDAQVAHGAARLDALSVGFDGAHAAGRLAPGRNAVCVTAELLLLG